MEAQLGVLAIAQRLFTGPRQVPHGCLFPRGDRDRGAIACASQASPWHGVPAVGFDAVPGFFWHEGGGHHPAVIVFFRQITGEPGATRARCIAKEEVCGFRLHLTDEVLAGTLTGPHGAQGGSLSAIVWGDRRHGHRLFVDIHADEECARLRHG